MMTTATNRSTTAIQITCAGGWEGQLLLLTSVREVKMPTEEILTAGLEKAWYQVQMPPGWVATVGIDGSACDGFELINSVWRPDLPGLVCADCQDGTHWPVRLGHRIICNCPPPCHCTLATIGRGDPEKGYSTPDC